jgi:gamma-glutamylputrescine oxidase
MPTSLLHSDTQLNQHSYYEASATRPPLCPPLQSTVRTDVVVVGAGFAGLSAAIALRQRGLSVVVLEANRVCSGASGRNGGQTIVGYASGMAPFEKQLGQSDAARAWQLSLDAIALVDQRIAQFQIDCDRTHGYLYVADSARKARALQDEMAELEHRYGFKATLKTGAAVAEHIQSPRYHASAFESTSGHLHPLQYGLGLAKAAQDLGTVVYEKSPALTLTHGPQVQITTPTGAVVAKWVFLAGNCTLNAYGPQLAPRLRPRIMPVGTYIIATEPLDPALVQQMIPSQAAVCDNNFVLDYFRFSADHRLLFGGRVSYTTQTPRHLKESMQQRMARVFPGLAHTKVDFVWGGFVDISLNRTPDFGRLQPNVYYAQGFSGHGVALAGMAGQLASDAIAGQAERFDLLARLRNPAFPGGDWLRTPALVLATTYSKIRDYF